MLLRPLAALTLVGAFCSFVSGARAQQALPPAASEPVATRDWLARIHEAASKSNFQGTFVVSGGGSVSSARIAHYCAGPDQFERIESLDGQSREILRHNDVVQTVWPDSRVVVVEQNRPLVSFPALLQKGDERIGEYYEVRRLGRDRVAGRDAVVLHVRPRDERRFGYRLWSDEASGLLLRSDVLGERGNVLETTAFTEVSIGVSAHPDQVLVPMAQVDGFRVIRPVLESTTLEAEGWTMSAVLPGFRQVSCVRRPIDGPTASEPGVSAEPALQAIYSDGLTYVSLFIEPYDAERHRRPIVASVGSTRTLMRRKGDWWVTVVGDVPVASLKAFANALERSN